jgi:predicted permease
MVLGAVVGLSGFQTPGPVESFLSKAAACMSPVSMLLTGIVISDYKLKELLSQWQVYVIAFMRLLVLPCIAGVALRLLKLEMLLLPTLMVLAMPCGLNTIVFPKLMGRDCKPGAAMAFITSILCCITIPLCLLFFGIKIQ